MAHTPGPWEASCEEYGEDGEWSIDTTKRQIARTNPYHLPSGEAKANAKLMAAAPELLEAGSELNALTVRAQKFLASYLVPDSGISDTAAVNELLGIFDGLQQRQAQTAWCAAIAKAKGRQ